MKCESQNHWTICTTEHRPLKKNKKHQQNVFWHEDKLRHPQISEVMLGTTQDKISILMRAYD